MQVHYKIPGWEPVRQIPVTGVAPASPFPTRARLETGPAVIDWRKLLRLDEPRPGAVVLGPPPRPAAMVESSASSEVRLMRSLLSRHGREASPQQTATPESAAVREMMLLLLDMQARQDELTVLRLQYEGI
jgi:hypothetical protein